MATKWFDRKFDFNLAPRDFPPLLLRLETAPARLRELAGKAGEDTLASKPEGKWSIKEQVAHLFVLEPLWQVRIKEIGEGADVLSPADLDNRATTEGGYNTWDVHVLLERFEQARRQTLGMLAELEEEDLVRGSLHPRLNKKMRVIDLAFFVAEHDDHHLVSIRNMLVD